MVSIEGTPKRRRPTMNDVAALAGVSQATVSLVLNGSPGAKLTEATRAKVRGAAEELGYRLPRRGLPDRRTQNSVIGMIVDEVATDPWMALAFEGAREKALEFGMNIFLATSNGNPETEAEIVKSLEDLDLAGIIYGTILTRMVKPIPEFYRHNTVLLNCYVENRQLHSVVPGDLLGGRMATQHLIESGRRRIGFINGQRGVDAAIDRLRGYRQALTSNDIPYDAALVRPGNWEPTSGYEHTKALLALDVPPDAIFCANDLMAQGCMEALHEVGIDVPGQIAVMGFDDRDVAKHMHPPLTTLVLPHYDMGAVAAESLIEMAGDHNTRPTQIKVECQLVKRESA